MDQLALLESRSIRNTYCIDEHLDVLDRVGQLMTLSETGFAITNNVASFYGVSSSTIRTIVQRHNGELVADGYKVLLAKEFRESHHETLGTNARFVSVFSKRAVLRIGMLLEDSLVAQEIRTQLLNAVSKSRNVPQNLLPHEKAEKILASTLRVAAMLGVPKHIAQTESCKYVKIETKEVI